MFPPWINIGVRRVRYDVTRGALRSLRCTQTTEDKSAIIIWCDALFPNDQFVNLLSYQRINRIPGMNVMCTKNAFFQTLLRMKGLFPGYYNFFPTTFQLPLQDYDFRREHNQLTSMGCAVTWIYQPRAGCGGRGIRLIQKADDIPPKSRQSGIIQKYASPYLLDGYKFDFRLFILISNLDPYTFYLYNEGLARFCSRPYASPTPETLAQRYSHLTNTAVNVTNYESHRRLLELASVVIGRVAALDQKGKTLWARIKQVVTLSVIAQYQAILQNVIAFGPSPEFTTDSPGPELGDLHRYFHILGIDIMVNDSCDPIVLELNDRPSMCVTYDLEQCLKVRVVADAIALVAAHADKRPEITGGGWQRLHPATEDTPFASAVEAMLQRSIQNLAGATYVASGKRSSVRVAPSRRGLPPLSMQ
jgi:hypothetical protein